MENNEGSNTYYTIFIVVSCIIIVLVIILCIIIIYKINKDKRIENNNKNTHSHQVISDTETIEINEIRENHNDNIVGNIEPDVDRQGTYIIGEDFDNQQTKR